MQIRRQSEITCCGIVCGGEFLGTFESPGEK